MTNNRENQYAELISKIIQSLEKAEYHKSQKEILQMIVDELKKIKNKNIGVNVKIKIKQPKRSEDKYWHGTRDFDHIQFENDLEEYISQLEESQTEFKIIFMPDDEIKKQAEKHGWDEKSMWAMQDIIRRVNKQ